MYIYGGFWPGRWGVAYEILFKKIQMMLIIYRFSMEACNSVGYLQDHACLLVQFQMLGRSHFSFGKPTGAKNDLSGLYLITSSLTMALLKEAYTL